MRLFELNDVVARLAAGIALPCPAHEALLRQVTLAWYLRQSDQGQAMALARAARTYLVQAGTDPDLPLHRQLCARLSLIEAECQWLASNFVQATESIQRALATFAVLQDAIGMADAHTILASVHSSTGDLPQRDVALADGVRHALQAKDSERVDFLQANQARYAALRDVRQCDAVWGPRFPQDLRGYHATVGAAINTYLGTRDYNSGQFGRALDRFDHAFEAACNSGQVLIAVIVAVNAGNTYMTLNDHDATLAWLQRGLELARPTGWAAAVGPCLRQMGETLRVMGRLDEAQLILAEAMQVYEPLRNSRNHAAIFGALGDLAFDRGEYEAALDFFRQLSERATRLAQTDLGINGQIGVANALLKLGNTAEAELEGLIAFKQAQAQGATASQMNALRLLARIHAARGDSGLALERMEQAITTAKHIKGYTLPGEFLFELAAQYASSGRMADAYAAAVRANAARESVLTMEASNRATAIQTRMETERVRAETEHHRRQAESETKRAALLQQTSDTLELLGTIGQEITSQLDQVHVFEAIEKHVHGLLDAATFAIYLMDADGKGLTSAYDIEDGVRLPGDHVDLNSPTSFSARCVREHRELLINESDPSFEASMIPGTLKTRSALFAPLTIGNRVLGVMTIQSPRANAYAEKEQLIFRTLCAYTAIALDNSVAYTHLRDAKDQLVAQEKLAALGALVAGVAHELNTPIGNSLLTVSALQQKTTALQDAVADGTLRRSSLAAYIAAAHEGTDIITRGLETAAQLVQSFKQVAVDQATEQRRAYGLLRTTQDTLAALHHSISKAGHRLEIDIPESISLDGYPGPYGQMITNFINNGLLHAFEGRRGGTMRLSARMLKPHQVEIEFSDDGVGIAQENLKRIFEPFFTTKMGQGGSGLGMSISYNIVTSLFGGEIYVDSVPGQGTRFTMRIPVEAPQHRSDLAPQYHQFLPSQQAPL
ncbi:MAG: tetratricopeptide repeat protein [Candidatus Saccharibacteria bacterium]|nr:tetratricopeptide repeat protein [Rhodoferax sp.]